MLRACHLRNMKKGDEVFFYHSNEGTDIVGIAKVQKKPIRIRLPMMIAGSQ